MYRKGRKSREMCLKNAKLFLKFIPEAVPEPDEIEAILEGRKDRAKNGTVPHEAIDWD